MENTKKLEDKILQYILIQYIRNYKDIIECKISNKITNAEKISRYVVCK